MKTKRALATAITRYECKYLACTTVREKEYWLRMMEMAQEQLDIINLEQSDDGN